MANKRVAVILGDPGRNKGIIDKVRTEYDNLLFTGFTSLQECLESSESSGTLYSRIIIYEKLLASDTGLVQGENDSRLVALHRLSEYMDDGRNETEVILLCNTKEPTGVHQHFVDILDSNTVVPALPSSVTVPIISTLIGSSIPEIKAKFYDLDEQGIKTRVASQAKGEIPEKKKPQPAKKGGLFGMFGKKQEAPKPQEDTRSAVDRQSETDRANESAAMMAAESGLGAGDSEAAMNYRSDNVESDSDEFSGPAGDLGASSGEDFGAPAVDFHGPEDGVRAVEGMFSGGSEFNFSEDGANHVQTGFLDDEDEGQEDDDPESGSGEDFSSDADGFSSSSGEDMEVVGGVWGEEEDASAGDDNADPDYDDGYDEEDDGDSWADEDDTNESRRDVNVMDRIVIVTGDRGSGVTTRAATIATETVSQGIGKVLLIDLDFEKAGVVGFLDDMSRFLTGNHGITSGTPYREGGLDVLSNGFDVPENTRDIDWVCDSRNYAEYTKIVIDCPLNQLHKLEELMRHTGIVVTVLGTPTGLMNLVRNFSNKELVPDSVARHLRDRGYYAVINEADDMHDVIKSLQSTLVFARVDWLSKVA